MNGQEVNLPILNEAVHDAMGSEDHFTHEGILEFWDGSARVRT